MQKIKLGDTELLVSSVSRQGYADNESLEITFVSGVTYAEVAAVYDRPNADADKLSCLEIYTEGMDDEGNGTGVWRQDGVHYGYVTPTDISHFDGVVRVTVRRESEAEIRVRAVEQANAMLLLQMAMLMGG